MREFHTTAHADEVMATAAAQYRSGDFDSAVQHYTTALRLCKLTENPNTHY